MFSGQGSSALWVLLILTDSEKGPGEQFLFSLPSQAPTGTGRLQVGADRTQTQQWGPAELGGHQFPLQPRRVREHRVIHSWLLPIPAPGRSLVVSEHLPRLVPHCASLLAKGRIGESLNPSASGERTPPAGLGSCSAAQGSLWAPHRRPQGRHRHFQSLSDSQGSPLTPGKMWP